MASSLALQSTLSSFHAATSFRRTALVSSTARPSISRSTCLQVRAGQAPVPPPQNPENFGLGGKGTWFGFGPRQELNVGRLGMIGFASALVGEVVTGKGVLGQLGVDPILVRYPFLFGLTFLLFGGLLGGYVVINNPPDFSKAPPNLGEGVPRNPFDKNELDRIPTYTRGGVVERTSGQKGREPYVSDLTEKKD